MAKDIKIIIRHVRSLDQDWTQFDWIWNEKGLEFQLRKDWNFNWEGTAFQLHGKRLEFQLGKDWNFDWKKTEF